MRNRWAMFERMGPVVLFVGLVLLAILPESSAQSVHLQGRITGADGNPIHEPNGVTMVLHVYDVGTGAQVYQEEYDGTAAAPKVAVLNGIFSVPLGSGVNRQPADDMATIFPLGEEREITVAINGGLELPERIRAASAAFALNAQRARDADTSQNSVRLAGLDAAEYRKFSNLTGVIAPGQIAASTITGAHIANGQITTNHLAAFKIDEPRLQDGAVTTAKLRDGEVKRDDIGDDQVTREKIAANAVDSDRIVDRTIADADINDGARISPTKIGKATTWPDLAPLGFTLQDQVQDVVRQLAALQAAGGIRFVKTTFSYDEVQGEGLLPRKEVRVGAGEAPNGVLILASAWFRCQQVNAGERESFAELRLDGSTRGDRTMGHVFDKNLLSDAPGGTNPYGGFCPSAGSGGTQAFDLVRMTSTCVLMLTGEQWDPTETNTIYWGTLRSVGSVAGNDWCRARHLVVIGL